MSELSSTYSEILVRVQHRGFVRLANDSGGPALVTLIWSADNRDGVIMVVTMGEKAETWMFGHDLLRRGCASADPIGDGLVTVRTAVGTETVGVTLSSPRDSASWIRVFINLTEVSGFLSAIGDRMLNAPVPDIESEIHAWFNGKEGS